GCGRPPPGEPDASNPATPELAEESRRSEEMRMDREHRDALIARYKEGYAKVEEALAGVTDSELDTRPAPGKWTAREIVHHLADSEMTSAIRLRRLLVEEKPVIQGYDQEAFARLL